MREKKMQLVITFEAAVEAMKLDMKAEGGKLNGRLIPIPSEISAGCGLAWKADLAAKEKLLAFMENEGIRWEAVYELELY